MDGLKKCSQCGASKERSEFYKHPMMADGVIGKCKPCTRENVRKNRVKRADYYIAYERERAKRPERKAQAKIIIAKWREANKHKKTAQAKLQYAMKIGKIVPQPCFICGEQAEAHHPNYSAPLDVVWLCPLHHRQAHGITKLID